jgi:hypothetical protein
MIRDKALALASEWKSLQIALNESNEKWAWVITFRASNTWVKYFLHNNSITLHHSLSKEVTNSESTDPPDGIDDSTVIDDGTDSDSMLQSIENMRQRILPSISSTQKEVSIEDSDDVDDSVKESIVPPDATETETTTSIAESSTSSESSIETSSLIDEIDGNSSEKDTDDWDTDSATDLATVDVENMRQQLLMFWDINDETKLMILNDILQLDSSIHLILSINDKKSNQYAFNFFTREYFRALKRNSHPTEDSQLIITSIPQSAATTDILRNSPPTEESTVSVESENQFHHFSVTTTTQSVIDNFDSLVERIQNAHNAQETPSIESDRLPQDTPSVESDRLPQDILPLKLMSLRVILKNSQEGFLIEQSNQIYSLHYFCVSSSC